MERKTGGEKWGNIKKAVSLLGLMLRAALQMAPRFITGIKFSHLDGLRIGLSDILFNRLTEAHYMRVGEKEIIQRGRNE